MDIELDEDSKQQIHSELKSRSRCEGEQLVAIDEEGKIFSVDNNGELYYVATLDAPAIATVIDAGRRREKSTPVAVEEQDTRDTITVSSRDASVTSQTSVFPAVTSVTEQVTTHSDPKIRFLCGFSSIAESRKSKTTTTRTATTANGKMTKL